MLEGGYSLEALTDSVAALMPVLVADSAPAATDAVALHPLAEAAARRLAAVVARGGRAQGWSRSARDDAARVGAAAGASSAALSAALRSSYWPENTTQ